MVEKKKRAGKRPARQNWSPDQRCLEILRDTTRPSQIGRNGTSEDLVRRTAGVQAAINKELHKIGAEARIQDLFLTRSGKYRGLTRPTNSAEQLLGHRHEVIQAALSADPSITGLETRTAWWWVKAHAIPVARYLGKGSRGTDSLREELEVEYEGVKIPSVIRWLSGAASVKARFNDKIITASSVVFAVSDESVYRSIRRSGVRLQGRRYEVEVYEEVRPDVKCGHCSGWGHIESKCERTNARCGWCAGQHETRDHSCPVEGCVDKKGHWCKHTVAKCANCGGPHFGQAKACPKKKAPPHRGERVEIPITQVETAGRGPGRRRASGPRQGRGRRWRGRGGDPARV